MKLRSRLNRRVGDRVYRKWYLDIPVAAVEQLGWSRGQELRARVDGDRLVIAPAGGAYD